MRIIFIVLLLIGIVEARNFKKFTNNIKLISDSKIYINKRNMLSSNKPIYGRYYSNNFLNQFLHNGIYNVTCEKKKNLYKIKNDCYMLVNKQDNRYASNLDFEYTDILYMKKSNAKNIKMFNHRSHMIECDYSKKYGIMHNCRIEIYKKIFH